MSNLNGIGKAGSLHKTGLGGVIDRARSIGLVIQIQFFDTNESRYPHVIQLKQQSKYRESCSSYSDSRKLVFGFEAGSNCTKEVLIANLAMLHSGTLPKTLDGEASFDEALPTSYVVLVRI